VLPPDDDVLLLNEVLGLYTSTQEEEDDDDDVLEVEVEQACVLQDWLVAGFVQVQYPASTVPQSDPLQITVLVCVHHPHVLSQTHQANASQAYIYDKLHQLDVLLLEVELELEVLPSQLDDVLEFV
jgi:hypothetical protein